MRKFLNPKFLSHGTNLGYLGSLNPKDLDEKFLNLVFLVPMDVPKGPVVVASLFRAKNLKTLRRRCE